MGSDGTENPSGVPAAASDSPTRQAQKARTLVTAVDAWLQAFGATPLPKHQADLLELVDEQPPAVQLSIAEALHWHPYQTFVDAVAARRAQEPA